MFCANCGTQMQDSEKFCPNCGTPAEVIASDEPQSSAQQPAYIPGNAAVGNGSSVSGGKKNLIPVFIIGAALVCVVLLVISNGGKVNHFIHKNFSSPESYYRYVQNKSASEQAKLFGDFYEDRLLKNMDFSDKSVKNSISMEIGKGGEEFLELAGLAGVDLSWLKSVQLEMDAAVRDNLLSLGLSTALNQKELIGGKVMMDIEEGELCMQIPALTKTYIGVDLEDHMNNSTRKAFREFQESQETSQKLLKAMPKRTRVEKLIVKYAGVANGCVEDVSKETVTLEVDGVEQKCTELKVKLDEDDLQDILKEVISQMREDKDLQKMIEDVADAGNFEMDGSEAYDQFQDGMKKLLDELKNSSDAKFDLVIKIYVDKNGVIRGKSFEYEDDRRPRNDCSLSILKPKHGKDVGYELTVEAAGGTKIKLTGKGKEVGGKLTGEYKVKYNGASLLELTVQKLDTDALRHGYPNGTVEAKLSSKVGALLGNSGTSSFLTDMRFVLESECSEKAAKCTLRLFYDKDDIGAVTLAAENKKSSKESFPSGKDIIMADDMDDLDDWLDEIDWDAFVSKLEKADLPSEITDLVEDVADMIDDYGLAGLGRMGIGGRKRYSTPVELDPDRLGIISSDDVYRNSY